MKRTQIHKTLNPPSAAPTSAGASMAIGPVAPVPKWAPNQSPKNEAPQASSGVRSQPITTNACASQRGTQALRTRESTASTLRDTV